MKEGPKFMIRNTPHTRTDSRQETPLETYFLAETGASQGPFSMDARVNKLEGNLKLLEKKYRDNLKVGFDHKIKAYRLQAVVERKLLRQAIQET